MNENDVLWQVVFVDRAGHSERVAALCGSEDEACRRREELTKEQEYADSFDYYRLDNDWVYRVQVVMVAEIEAERQRRIEERTNEVRQGFWQQMSGEDFVESCRKLVAWVTKDYDRITDELIRQNAEEENYFYTPWRDFHKSLKVFAYKHYTKPQTLTVWGMLVGNSLGGSVRVPIRQFYSCGEFQEWAAREEEALAEFISKTREERLFKCDICALCRFYHQNVCQHGGSCMNAQQSIGRQPRKRSSVSDE